MHLRAAPALLLLAVAALAPGCFVTRPLGLGPDPGPNEVVKGDGPEIIFEKAQRLFAEQDWKHAADTFHKVWSDFPKSDLASDAQFYEADSRFRQGKYNGAFELWKKYLKDWPLSPHAPTVQKRIYDMGTYLVEAGQHGFLGIFNYASEGVDQLDYLVSAFPHGDLADDALIYMADFEMKDRQTDAAIGHLHDLLDNYPTSEWALEARLRLAKAYRAVNRGTKYDADALQRAAAEYRTYVELVSADRARASEYAAQLDGARAELADVEEQLAAKRVEAADFYLRTGNPDAARAELRNAIRDFPHTRSAADARSRLGIEQPQESPPAAPETNPGGEP